MVLLLFLPVALTGASSKPPAWDRLLDEAEGVKVGAGADRKNVSSREGRLPTARPFFIGCTKSGGGGCANVKVEGAGEGVMLEENDTPDAIKS